MLEKVLYQELRPDEFVKRVNICPIAYLPLGTLEWHSFHLPYGVDMLMPLEMFKQIAERVGGVVLPPLFLGPDGALEHEGKMYYGMDIQSFDEGNPSHLIGSAYYIPKLIYMQIIEHILKNLKRNGFAALIAYGHGPSATNLQENREPFEKQFGLRILNLSELCGDELNGMPMDHAAFNETALMMALRPDLTELSLLPDGVPPIAVWGQDPRTVTMELSKQLAALYVTQASQKLIELNKTLPKPNLQLKFSHVKDLTENKP